MKLPPALCNAIRDGPLDESIHRDWVLSWFSAVGQPTIIQMGSILYPNTPTPEQRKRWLLCLKLVLQFDSIHTLDLSGNNLENLISATLDLLPNRPSIRSISLSNCCLTTSNLDLSRVREVLPNLRQISLEGNNLSIGLRTVGDDMTDTEEVMSYERADLPSILKNLLHLGGLRLLEVLNLSKTGLQCMGKKLAILSWVLARYTPIRAVNLSKNGLSQKKSAFIIAGFDELQAVSKSHVLRLTLGLDVEKSRDLQKRLDRWNHERMHENQDRALVRLGLFGKEERIRAKTDLANTSCFFERPFKGPDVKEILGRQLESLSAHVKLKARQILNPRKYRMNCENIEINDENQVQTHTQSANIETEKQSLHSNGTHISHLTYELSHHVSQYIGGNKCRIVLMKTRT